MSCNATIETKTNHDVISVPIQSVTARQDEKKPEMDAKDENPAVKNAKKKETEIQEIVFVVENGVAKSKKIKTRYQR